MAIHGTKVKFADEPKIGNKAMVFTVRKDGNIHGHLMVGKASLFWFEKSAKKKAKRMSWTDLAQAFKGRAEKPVTRP